MIKIKYLIKYSLFVGLVGFTNCTEELDPKLFEVPDFPVVIGFIAPELAQTKIFVGLSAAFNQTIDSTGSRLVLKNAVVKISDNANQSAILKYNDAEQSYVADSLTFPIRHNRTYFLEVQVNNQTLSATCVTPSVLASHSVESTKSNVDTYVKTQWLDQSGEINYYRLKGNFRGKRLNNSEISYDVSWGNDCKKKASLLDDANFDGKIMSSPLGNISNFGCNGFNSVLKNDKVTIELISGDENYFKYHKTAFAALESTSFSDPVSIYTNIKNGQGVFAAYTTKTVVFIL